MREPQEQYVRHLPVHDIGLSCEGHIFQCGQDRLQIAWLVVQESHNDFGASNLA